MRIAPTATTGEPMSLPAPTTVLPAAPSTGGWSVTRPPKSAQAALAAFALCVLGLLAFKVYAPRLSALPTEPIAAPVGGPTHSVDLNTADRAELMQLPGVGPNLADAILSHRTGVGRFDAVDDLTAVKGVGGKTLDKLRPWVAVSGEPGVERLERKKEAAPVAATGAKKLQPGDRPLNLNTATEAELQRLPHVGPVTARKIVDARAAKPFKTVDDLDAVKGVGAKTMTDLRPLVTVGD